MSPFTPTALGYVLIRIPFLIADFLILGELLKRYRATHNFNGLGFYLFSSVILFHQYYSGQLDLVAIAPFFFGVIWLERDGLSYRAAFLLALSLAFKPFGLLFYPILFAETIRRKNWLGGLGLLVATVLAYKLTEVPYSLTSSYHAVVGASSGYLISPGPWEPWPLFPVVFGALSLVYIANAIYRWWQWAMSEAIVMVTLALGALATHSAGWMAWAVPFGAIALIGDQKTPLKTWVWWVWSALFVAKWALVAQGPLWDSLGVLTNTFFHHHFNLPLGGPYLAIAHRFGVPAADRAFHLSDVAFALCSLFLLVLVSYRIVTTRSLPRPVQHLKRKSPRRAGKR